MTSNKKRTDKWYKPYDLVIWFGLLGVILLGAAMSGSGDFYSSDIIKLDRNIDSIAKAIEVTDEKILEYGDKYELYQIRGENSSKEGIINKEPKITISYIKHGVSRSNIIDIDIDTDDNAISWISGYSFNRYGDKEILQYNPKELDLPQIYDIIYEKADMETVLNGYEPGITFNIRNDELYVNISYYKKMKNSGVDYDSKVYNSFTINLNNMEVESSSSSE